ncbi:hypothetical protein AK812_SmicGene36536 [Symbiodinium microadriaticum]|uniref:Ion transport domain-containing protein n=1 Tax=Symbiodinium microadriaticum TaxID=2951 RepID=A0A1Q9CIM2_SYMMI|nr:hypothetical protein AK812_SmicGene36536 [Symbiodinium microadriaticum]
MVNDRAVARYLTHRRDMPALACQRAPTCVGCRNCGQFLKNIVTAAALHFDDEAPPWQVVHDLLMQDFQLWAAVCKRGQKRHRWRQFLLGVIGPPPPPHPGKEVIERIHKARMAMTTRLSVKTVKKRVHRSPAETLDLSATHCAAATLILNLNGPQPCALRGMRFLRVFRYFSALRVLVLSIVSTINSLLWTIVLLFIIFYSFGVILTQLVTDYCRFLAVEASNNMNAIPECPAELDKYWSSIGQSMLTLFYAITNGVAWSDAVRPLEDVSMLAVGFVIFYIIISVFTLLNVVTGVFVNTAIERASADKDIAALKAFQKRKDLASAPGDVVKMEKDDAIGDGNLGGDPVPGAGGSGGHPDSEPPMLVDATGGSPMRAKRTRDQLSDEGRPSSAAPITSGEMRSLLQEHLATITSSFRGLEGRLAEVEGATSALHGLEGRLGEVEDNCRSSVGRLNAVEGEVSDSKREQKVLHSRIVNIEKKEATNDGKIKQLAKEINDLKTKQTTLPFKATDSADGAPSDPWAAYRAQHGPVGGGAPRVPEPRGDGGARDELSDEDRRTLVFGGWSQDTKKQIILDESSSFLRRDELKDLVDSSELLVWGPRKSFGMLRFKLRDGEDQAGVRDRMWKTIQALRASVHRLQSTGAADGGKPMWAQFVKTKEARKRSSHGSLIRRVCLAMVEDCRTNQEAHNMTAGVETSYDVDWGSGTVWCSEWKLGSSIHRQPRGDNVRVLSSGWIDLEAISRATGVAFDVALCAFEREL